MLSQLLRPLLVTVCVCALAAAAVPAIAGAVTVGISDNGPTMFSEQSFLRLNIRQARDIVYWNVAVMRDKRPLQAVRAWVIAAETAGVTPMISFAGNGNYIPGWRQYGRAVQAFVRDFPRVKTYTAWNEPDWTYHPRLARNPKLAADYFNVLVRRCRHCTVAAGDLYLPAKQLGPWIRKYRRYLHAPPKAWALHNYHDIRSHNASQLRTMLHLTSGQIWLTEISGVERRGHWQYRNQSVFAAARDEKYLFSLPQRFHRLKRIYHYQWQGTRPSPDTGWDSGLIGPLGVPRPAYRVVAKAAGPRHTRDTRPPSP
jgi:hypothetical protein